MTARRSTPTAERAGSLVDLLVDYCRPRAEPVHCVGGCVRDRLLGRPLHDLDVVTAGALDLARQFARHAHAAFVLLDDGRGTARVVTPDQDHLDFTERQGTLPEDLARRDYTINAVACALADWPAAEPAWIDPHGGLDDLERRSLRVVSDHSLADDPLRILRGYRLAATLGLTIAPDTRALMRRDAPGLSGVAGERVQQEWLPLLAVDGAEAAVATAEADGVMAVLLPGWPDGRAARLGALDAGRRRLAERWPRWPDEPDGLALLRLAALLGPEGDGPARAAVTRALRLSRRQARRLAAFRAPPASAGDADGLGRLVMAHGEEALGALLVAGAAGVLAEPELSGGLELLCGAVLPAWRAAPLLTGDDLRRELGVTPGPRFGPVLEAVRLAQLTGRCRTREAALALAREVWRDDGE